MSEHEPGTVAVATVKGVPNVRVMKSGRALAPVHTWFSMEPVGGHFEHASLDVTDVRPLVVLDAEDREQVERLARELALNSAHRGSMPRQSEIAGVQAALRSLVKPPKPEEPQGLGAVVRDRSGRRWARTCSCVSTVTDKADWRPADHDGPAFARAWDEIDVPDEAHILSRGVE